MERDLKNFFKVFVCLTALLVTLACALVVVFDPFYHYHAPYFKLKAVLNEKEYQCVGTLKNFDYDAVLAGSSMIENNDNALYNAAFDCTCVKAARSYGATADLFWMLERAYEGHEIKQVFYNIDPSALHAETETTFEKSGCPMYLYDENPFNDIKYLLNKDVLLKRIPYQIAQSLSSSYNEDLSYNWAEGKDFSKAGALSQYYRLPKEVDPLEKDANKEALYGNIALLERLCDEHPETEYRFFFPAYSMLWWDMINRNGELESTFYEIEETLRALTEHENARVYVFLDDEETVTDLDNYMDTMHCRPEINSRMLDMMAKDEHIVGKDDIARVMEGLRSLVKERILKEEIPLLEKEDVFLYDYYAE